MIKKESATSSTKAIKIWLENVGTMAQWLGHGPHNTTGPRPVGRSGPQAGRPNQRSSINTLPWPQGRRSWNHRESPTCNKRVPLVPKKPNLLPLGRVLHVWVLVFSAHTIREYALKAWESTILRNLIYYARYIYFIFMKNLIS